MNFTKMRAANRPVEETEALTGRTVFGLILNLKWFDD